LQLINRSMAI